MPVDTSIYSTLGVRPKSALEYGDEMDMAALRRQNLQTNALAMQGTQQKLDEGSRMVQEQAGVRNRLAAMATQQPGATDHDRANALYAEGTPTAIAMADKLRAAGDKSIKDAADARLANAHAGNFDQQTSTGKSDQAIKAFVNHVQQAGSVNSHDGAVQWALKARSLGYGPMADMPSEQFVSGLSNIPATGDVAGMEKWKSAVLAGGMTGAEQMAEKARAAKAAEDIRQFGITSAETGRHNVAGEGIQIRGQNMVAGTAAAGQRSTAQTAANSLAQGDRHFTATQSAPKYMETDAGLVVLPTRLAPGQVPVGQPVAGADGQPLGKPLKALPPAVNEAIIGNAQSLYSLDKAIALLKGKNVDSANGDQAATGWKGYLPQAILNRVDPSGVDTRAELSDIGSLKIHDRSGAAVTVSESPRLMPFIPQSTDPTDVAIRKLTRLMEEAQRNQQALSDTYSKDQGYKPSPVKPGAARAGAAPSASNVVTTPDGVAHTFQTPQAAAQFKAAAGIK